MRLSFVCVLIVAACSIDSTGLLTLEDGGAGIDSGPGFDGGPGFDSGPVDGGNDTEPDFDSGVDGGPVLDAALVDGGPMPDAFDAGCAESCDGSTYVRCVGDGTTMREECDHVCLSGADAFSGVGCYDLDPSNVERPLNEAPMNMVDPIGNDDWDTDACDTLPGYWEVQGQTGARGLCILSFGDLEIRGDVRVSGFRPLVILAAGTVRITGSLLADAEGTDPGPGGGVGGTSGMAGGFNPGQPGLNGVGANAFPDSGGGGGGGGHAGGSGGDGGGAGIASGGNAFMSSYFGEPLHGGSGGGRGGTGRSAGDGGGGGGAIQISARGGVEISGSAIIDLGGGGGAGGRDGDAEDFNIGSGGGGGSGGVLLIESAGNISIDGAVFSPGGGGGGAAGCRTRGDADDGGEDSPTNVGGGASGRSCSGDGGTYGASGGAGGVDGVGTDGNSNARSGANGGGGGGGGGLLVLRGANRLGIGRELGSVLVRTD
ncbi:MAG: hypothetical protein ACI9KE_001727 [Polyangiales bacterium]|jgi:hypothetical protein